MAARDASLYEEIILESNNGTKTIDLKLGVLNIKYYEDIFSPTITAQIAVINSGGTIPTGDGSYQSIYSGLPLRGGERVSIKISGNSDNNKDGLNFSSGPTEYFYVTKVTSVLKDGQKEIFLLNLVSREAIANETSRVYQKFPKAPITDHVGTIIKEYLRSDKSLKSDPVRDTYSFIGNLKRPFDVLVWLASRSVPQTGIAGYFFYETKDGFNFRSVDSLINEGKRKPKAEYYQQEYQGINVSTDYRILSYSIDRNHDLLEKLRLGTYSSFFAQYDPLFGRFTLPQEGKFTLNDYKNKTTNLGENPEIPRLLNDVGLTLADMPSRIITSVLDVGTLEKGVSLEPGANAQRYQREALMRYNLLFMQILSMTVPLNLQLRAGDVISCKFIKLSSNSNEFESGLYMIKELCHHFDGTESLTSMKLIRDTYGEFAN